jgi:hypothetical protein
VVEPKPHDEGNRQPQGRHPYLGVSPVGTITPYGVSFDVSYRVLNGSR